MIAVSKNWGWGVEGYCKGIALFVTLISVAMSLPFPQPHRIDCPYTTANCLIKDRPIGLLCSSAYMDCNRNIFSSLISASIAVGIRRDGATSRTVFGPGNLTQASLMFRSRKN